MKKINAKSSSLKKILANITDILEKDSSYQILDEVDDDICDHHPISDEYLNFGLQHPNKFAFPRMVFGVAPQFNHKCTSLYLELLPHLNSLQNFLGAPVKALTMLYPPGGYIGWHHNGNAPGYNILFTWSETGEGSFTEYDMTTGNKIVIPDEQGWNVKVGYYPDMKETDILLWHKAECQCKRATIAFIIDDKCLWEDMIDEIINT